MRLGQHQEKFAKDLVKLLSYAFSLGYDVRIAEVFRTLEQQKIYMRLGRTKTMNSMHLKKCAADLYFTKNGKLVYPSELGKYWESLDPLNRWGGHWKSFVDKPHYERKC